MIEMKLRITEVEPYEKPRCPSGCRGACLCVTCPKHDPWFDALIADDAEAMDEILKQKDHPYFDAHFCGRDRTADIIFRGVDMKGFNVVNVMTPWNLATCLGATKVMELFLSYGVDPTEQDNGGKNVVHALIYQAFENPKRTDKQLNIFKKLQELLTEEQLRDLLFTEDLDGFRPLELAAHLGQFKFVDAIFNTKGVYLVKQAKAGMFNMCVYDITDYETTGPGSRHHLSVLNFLAYVDKEAFNDDFSKLMQDLPFKVWCDNKIRCQRHMLFIWFLIRLMVIILVGVWAFTGGELSAQERRELTLLHSGQLVDPENITTSACIQKSYSIFPVSMQTSMIIEIVMMVAGGLIVLFDVCEYFYYNFKANLKKFGKTSKGSKCTLVSVASFRTMQFFLGLGLLLRPFVKYLPDSETKIISDFLYVSNSMCFMWSILFFFQLAPYIGPSIIRIQLLVSDMVQFLLVLYIFIVPFAITFNQLILHNMIGECDSRFDGILSSIYSIFTASLNMLDFRGLDTHTSAPILVLHQLYVFLIAVLLLNFLIAKFSEHLSAVNEWKWALNQVHWLNMAVTIDCRMRFLFPKLVEKIQQRYFAYCPTTERYLLPKLSCRSNLE